MTPLIALLLLTAEVAPGPAPTPAETASTPAVAADTFTARLAALELALSTVVAEPPSRWTLEPLRSEADRLVADAVTEAQRSAARDVGRRVGRFASIADAYRGMADRVAWRPPMGEPRANAPARNVLPAADPTRTLAGRDLSAADTRQPPQGLGHDTQGVLRPVVSSRPGAPKFAVVDDEGRVRTLITPAPELAPSLERLVGRRVALDGRRGYLSDIGREHLVAERVTPLGDATLRR